jgi:hypothetical protein
MTWVTVRAALRAEVPPVRLVVEAPWLVKGGHGAPLRHRNWTPRCPLCATDATQGFRSPRAAAGESSGKEPSMSWSYCIVTVHHRTAVQNTTSCLADFFSQSTCEFSPSEELFRYGQVLPVLVPGVIPIRPSLHLCTIGNSFCTIYWHRHYRILL